MKLQCSAHLLLAQIDRIAGALSFTEDSFSFRGKLYDPATCSWGEEVEASYICNLLLRAGKPEYDRMAADIIDRMDYKTYHFAPTAVGRMLIWHGEQLPGRCHEKIKNYLYTVRHEFVGNDLDFIGVNDNYPLLSTYTACVFWKLYGDREMLDNALRRFGQLERLLKRRGCLSEYCSVAYTPLQLFVSAALEKIAPDDRCRQIALDAQARIWTDFLSHYHPETGSFSGPFSRHYILRGRPMVSLIGGLFPQADGLPEDWCAPASTDDWYFLLESYACPEAVCRLITGKTYPFVFTATSEYAASTDATPEAARRDMTKEEDCYEHGAGVAGIYTYQTSRYGVGTATNEWHNVVQTTSFFVNYRRKDALQELSDSRYVYCRYLLNDESNDDQAFMDQGRKLAFGRENQALVLYKPKIAAIPPEYGDTPADLALNFKRQEISGNLGVTSAKLVIHLPLNGVKPDCVMLGEQVLEACEGKSDSPKSVYIKDGDMYLAFHPTAVDDLGRDCAMTVRLRDDTLEIALYNYVGEKKDFARRHFLHVRNGFLFSAGSIEENGSFEAFLAREKQTVIEDRMITSNHARQTFIRQVDAVTAQRKLSCEYAPASESIKFLACDDYALEFPKLEISGFDTKQLPLM